MADDMNNLPDIGFEEKKKKEKKGVLPWLKSKFGGTKAGPVGSVGPGSSANFANIGRVGAAGGGRFASSGSGFFARIFGAGKFGAAGAGGGLLAGKAGIIAGAVALAAIGAGLYMANQPGIEEQTASSFNSYKSGSDYVPAALRSGLPSGSSLDMFKETNKGFLGDEEPPKEEKKPAKEQPAKEEAPRAEPDAGQMAGDMAQKLAGGAFGDLTNSLGGGSNKFSGAGGFSNKFGQGQFGPKTGLSGNIGAGFDKMPKFEQRTKMLAMQNSKKPVYTKSAAKKGSYGKGAWNQARGVKGMQQGYTGVNADGQRHTQDKAWEGTTSDGTVGTGGSGVGSGGAGLSETGVVTNPSIDNTGGGGTTTPDTETPPPSEIDVETPWADAVSKALMYIMLSALFSMIGGNLIELSKTLSPWSAILYAIGLIFCIIALVLGLMALMLGIEIMTKFGQTLLGTIYTIGGVVAMAAAVMAMTGKSVLGITPMWMAAAAGIIALLGSMVSAK